MKRHEYLEKKNARIAEIAQHAEQEARRSEQEAINQVSHLKNDLKEVRNQIKSETFVEYKQDISQLRKKLRQLKKSTETWQARYAYINFDMHACTMFTRSMFHTHITCSCHRRDKTKKSCQELGLYKIAAESKKKLKTKNKYLRSQLKTKVEGKAELRKTVKHAKADAAYWEERATNVAQELAGNECVSHLTHLTSLHTYIHTHYTHTYKVEQLWRLVARIGRL